MWAYRRKGDRTQLINEDEDDIGSTAGPGAAAAVGGYGAVAFQAAETASRPAQGGPDINLNLGKSNHILLCVCFLK